MKKCMVLAGAFLVLGVLGGCGSGSADSIVKEQIKTTNELADLMGDLKGNEAKIKAANQKLKELKEAFEKRPKEEQEAAIKSHGNELAAAATKVATKMMGGAADILKSFGGDLNKAAGDLGKAGKEAADKAGKEINKTGKDTKEAVDKAGKDLKKAGEDLFKDLNKAPGK